MREQILDEIVGVWQRIKKSGFAYKNLIGEQADPSTTVVDTLQLCKAWVVFNGTGATGLLTPLDSYNMASVNKTATGKYTFTVTTPFSTANYVVVPNCNDSASGNMTPYEDSGVARTTTVSAIITRAAGGANADPSVVCVAMFGRQ